MNEKLTTAQIVEIIDVLSSNVTQSQLAEKYGVTQQAISLIWNKHLSKKQQSNQ